MLHLPDTMNDDLLEILGMANFRCAPFAHAMQAAGEAIPARSENEQAHVIFKLLGIYAEHGADWREHAALWAESLIATAKSRRAEKSAP